MCGEGKSPEREAFFTGHITPLILSACRRLMHRGIRRRGSYIYRYLLCALAFANVNSMRRMWMSLKRSRAKLHRSKFRRHARRDINSND
ncbi:unnamed protein product [Lampetra fluviatilis]